MSKLESKLLAPVKMKVLSALIFGTVIFQVSLASAAHLNCISKDEWNILDNQGALLGAEKQNNFFEVDSELQSKLICGNPLRKPPVTLELSPEIKVLEQQPGFLASFERRGKNSFSFWLTGKNKKRVCVISCEPKI